MSKMSFAATLLSSKECPDSGKIAVTGREVFYRLLHFHEYHGNRSLAQTYLRHYLDEAERHFLPQFKPYCPTAIASLRVTKSSDSVFTDTDKFKETLRLSAPVILTEPCWLQDIYIAASNQEGLCAALFRVYLAFDEADYAGSYWNLLARFGIASPPIYAKSYCGQEDLLDGVFDFAAVQLALAFMLRSMSAEILGFTLAFCRSHTLGEHYFPGQVQNIDFFSQRRELLARQRDLIEKLIEQYLQDNSAKRERRWKRIQSGFWLYQYLFIKTTAQFHDKLTQHMSPAQAMLKLLQRKAAAATGHHGRIVLAGRSLDDWFDRLSTNGEAFLTALRQSPYVDIDSPEKSRLLSLFSFEGPMFGILKPDEVAIVRNWLFSGAKSQPEIGLAAPTSGSVSFQVNKSRVPESRFERLSNRQLFYYLINAEHYPEVLPQAEAKLKRQLAVCKILADSPLKTYTHEAFEHYLQTLYRREMAAYQPLTGKPKISRQAYVWGLEQFAPTVLIDGAWLQHCQWLKYRYPEISAILFRIYADELGNGKMEQSHPVVFRKLMQQLELDMPPIHSKEFSERQRFVDGAYDLPVFMLSLANYPHRYLPELLGLNLAIELSGLGNVYMRMVDELNYWHIDSTIARLHITIDNFADGHAAQAKRAIQCYLDEVLAAQGERAMQLDWRRIYIGYCSLKMVCWRFKLAVPMVYMRNKLFFRLTAHSDNNNK